MADMKHSSRAEHKKATKRLTVCAILSALGVALSWLGSLVGVLDLCTPLIASLLLVPVVIEYGKGYPWGFSKSCPFGSVY